MAADYCDSDNLDVNKMPIQNENEMKCRYETRLLQFYDSHSKNKQNYKKPWSSERISQVIQQIKLSRTTMQRKSIDYYWLSKYDYMEIGGEEILIFRKKSVKDPTILIVPMEKYYEMLSEIHKNNGHGGRLKMIKSIRNKLHIPKKPIEIFVDLCSVCKMKRMRQKKNIETHSSIINQQKTVKQSKTVTQPKTVRQSKTVTQSETVKQSKAVKQSKDVKQSKAVKKSKTVKQPITSKNSYVKGQIDLLDLQSAPDGEYKWLMIYEDDTTKFLHLRPLKTKDASEIAMELLKIFLEFGVPCILQSGIGREFIAHVIDELVKIWPECKTIQRGPEDSHDQGSIELSHQEIQDMLWYWMQDNKCTKWSVGCFFVQYYKNCSCHHIIFRSPYQAMFGFDPKTILKWCFVQENLSLIHTEEELDKVTTKESMTTQNNETNNDASNDIPPINIVKVEEKISEIWVEVNPTELNIDENGADIIFSTNDGKETCLRPEETSIMPKVQNELVSSDDQTSISCIQSTSDGLCCRSCSQPVHGKCGVSIDKVIYRAHVLCSICQNKQYIDKEQFHRGIKRSAEKMDDPAVKMSALEIGDSVFLNIPIINHEPLDRKNILGKVVDTKNGLYKIGTSSGTIKTWFPPQDLKISAQEYWDVVSELPITLQQAFEPIIARPGDLKSNCNKNKCVSNKCQCLKNNLPCTSRCYQCLACTKD